MGWWSKLKKKVKKAANAVKNAVNEVGEAVADVVETVGNGIGDGLEAVGNFLDKHVPGVGRYFLGPIFRWAGRVVSGAFTLVSSVVKLITGIVGGVISGVMKFVGGLAGIFVLDFSLMGEGLMDIVNGVLGSVIVVLGDLVAFIQTVLVLQHGKRKLTDFERALLKRVFRDSLSLYNIRLWEGFVGLFSIPSRAFTLGNNIYLRDINLPPEYELLVHECVHVWQNQHTGSSYTSSSLLSQIGDDPYDWESQIKNPETEWWEFGVEAQAEMIEDVYLHGELICSKTTTSGNGVFFNADGRKCLGQFIFNGVDHTNLANNAVSTIRGNEAYTISSAFD